jgi:hypothetical protein
MKNKKARQILKGREVERNQLREMYGNKGISNQWHKKQVEKYGQNEYITMVQSCDPRGRRNKIVGL